VKGGWSFSLSLAGEEASGAFLFLLIEADFVSGVLAAFVLRFWRFVPLRSDTILIDVKVKEFLFYNVLIRLMRYFEKSTEVEQRRRNEITRLYRSPMCLRLYDVVKRDYA
jgi:hypothetical protein